MSLYPLIFFGFRRASVVHVVVGGMEQLPRVELGHHARPVGQQVEAAEGQVGEGFVLGVGSRSLFVGRRHFVGVSGMFDG